MVSRYSHSFYERVSKMNPLYAQTTEHADSSNKCSYLQENKELKIVPPLTWSG